MGKVRVKPKVVLTNQSQFVSDRGASPRIILLHSTESHNYPDSARDLEGVAGWFSDSRAQVSCDRIVDGDATTAICNTDPKDKYTWQAGWINRFAVGIEQVGFASYGLKVWKKKYREEIKEAARNIADFSLKFDIPIKRAKFGGIGIIRRDGVTMHKKVPGNDHTDPGAYPFRLVLFLARRYRKKRVKRKGV